MVSRGSSVLQGPLLDILAAYPAGTSLEDIYLELTGNQNGVPA
jgi:hypothetical protein